MPKGTFIRSAIWKVYKCWSTEQEQSRKKKEFKGGLGAQEQWPFLLLRETAVALGEGKHTVFSSCSFGVWQNYQRINILTIYFIFCHFLKVTLFHDRELTDRINHVKVC